MFEKQIDKKEFVEKSQNISRPKSEYTFKVNFYSRVLKKMKDLLKNINI